MKTMQKLRDGSEDPLGRSVEHGFAIVVTDAAGKASAWADAVFATVDAANETAARCVPKACDIRPVRRIWHFVGKPGRGQRSTVIVD